MASISPMECGVCNEEFDEDDFCPRILHCSHTLCTECIKQLIAKGTKSCPFCRATFDLNSATDVNINRAFLDLIQFLSSKNSNQENAGQEKVTPLNKRINDFKKETIDRSEQLLSYCQELEILVESSVKDIEETKSDICVQNILVNDEILPKFTEIVKCNERRDENLDEQKLNVLACLDDIKKMKSDLENLIQRLDAVNTVKEASSAVEAAEKVNRTVNGWHQIVKEFLFKNQSSLKSTIEAVNATKKLVSDTVELLRANPPPLIYVTSLCHRKVEKLQEMSKSVFESLTRQGKIFAVQEHEGITRTATITLKDDRIFVHHLRKEPPPWDARLLNHKDLMSLQDCSSRLTFFELCAGETTLGHLVIRLAPYTAAARNFALLCTGETGPSYAQTNMIDVIWKGSEREGVRGGDYEFNNGTGGEPLIPGLQEALNNSEYQRPWKAGMVWGHSTENFVHFCINTHNRAGRPTCYQSFGIVEDGLKVLKNAISRFRDIKQVEVKDCGAVLCYSFNK